MKIFKKISEAIKKNNKKNYYLNEKPLNSSRLEVNNSKQKKCPKCKRFKPTTRQYFYFDKSKSKKNKTGLTSHCIECQKKRFKTKKYKESLKHWKNNNKDKVAKYHQNYLKNKNS